MRLDTSPPDLPYKLVVLDLDGTLIGKDLILSPQSKEVIARSMEVGARVTLATGRMFQATVPFARELGIREPLICYQGALIKDMLTGEVLYHQPVPLALAREVIRIVQGWGLHINVYLDDELFVEKETPEARRYGEISRVAIHAVGDLLAFLQRDPTKIVIVSEEEAIDRILPELRRHFEKRLYITKSYPIFAEVAHPECSKGEALEFLAHHYGIRQEETLAVGDSPNDLEMIVWAGLGVAMGNASPEVIAAADWVTAPLAGDGVAVALREFVLNHLPTFS